MTTRAMSRRWLVPAIGLVAIVAAACGTDDGEAASSSESAPPPSDTAAVSANTSSTDGVDSAEIEAIARELPFDFKLSAYQGDDALGGSEVLFSEVIALGKPVVLNMWAGLCPPCRAEMPDLEAVHQQFGDHIVLLGLDVGLFTGLGNKDDAIALIDEIGVTYPAGNTTEAQVVTAYKVLGMPSTYFIKTDGSVMQKWTGALNQAKMTELVEKLIAAS